MRNKNPKDFDILTLFLSVKKDFSTEHQNAAWMKKYCDVNAFSDRLKHYHTWQRCPLSWIEMYMFSLLFIISYVCFDTVCCPSSRHVRFVTLLNEFGCLYTLTRDVFKGHVTLKCTRRCTTTSWMWPLCANEKKKSTIFDFIVQPRPFCCSQIARFYFWWHLKKETGHGMKLRSKSAWN